MKSMFDRTKTKELNFVVVKNVFLVFWKRKIFCRFFSFFRENFSIKTREFCCSTKENKEFGFDLSEKREVDRRKSFSWSNSSRIASMRRSYSELIDLSVGLSRFRAAEAEIDRLQKEAENLTRRKAQENLVEQIEARESSKRKTFRRKEKIFSILFLVTKLSNLLEDLKEKRSELEQTRTAIVRQMQQIHEQIGAQRKKGFHLFASTRKTFRFFASRTRRLERKISVREEENTRARTTRPIVFGSNENFRQENQIDAKNFSFSSIEPIREVNSNKLN